MRSKFDIIDGSSKHVEDMELVGSLSQRIRCLPGRVAVLMDPVPETFGNTGIYMPTGQFEGKYRPDVGTVVASGVDWLEAGQKVGVKPYDGKWYRSDDLEVCPEGRELRFYGVVAPADTSIVYIV